MAESSLLIAALAFACFGMAWLALSMDVHWQQVGGTATPSPRLVKLLRSLAALSLVASLWLSLMADSTAMAVLVWMMNLAAGAVVIALLLAWRPGWLRLFALMSAKRSTAKS